MAAAKGKWFELRIHLIDPIDDCGMYNPRDAETIDFVSVPFRLKFTFFKTLTEYVILLLTRNGLLPED